MRRYARILVAAFFYYSGLVALFRWFMRWSGQRLIILNYHQASYGDLQRHLLYLRRHYRVLHLDEALAELYTARGKRKKTSDRRTPLVLTFDDGYRDNYTHAFLLARQLRVPITIFLVPGYMEHGARFWWFEADHLVQHAQVDTVVIEERMYDLKQVDDRVQLRDLIDRRVRFASSVAQREAFLDTVRKVLAVPVSPTLEEELALPLTWAEVSKMQESGWVSFGAHTMHHPILSCLSNPDELRYEVTNCRQVMEQRLGLPVRTFAYPIGNHEHIGAAAVKAVQEAGYDWAVTTERGFNTPGADPYHLKRVLGDTSRHWLLMAAEICGIWHVCAPLWKPFIDENNDI